MIRTQEAVATGTMEEYLSYLAHTKHPVSGQKPVAYEYLKTKYENDPTLGELLAHIYSGHGYLDHEEALAECQKLCGSDRKIFLQIIEAGN